MKVTLNQADMTELHSKPHRQGKRYKRPKPITKLNHTDIYCPLSIYIVFI
jgi:hypothetical protein